MTRFKYIMSLEPGERERRYDIDSDDVEGVTNAFELSRRIYLWFCADMPGCEGMTCYKCIEKWLSMDLPVTFLKYEPVRKYDMQVNGDV